MHLFRFVRGFAVACSVFLFGTASLRAENWPTWRGPTNDGISTETKVPTVWGEKKNVAWKLPMPGKAGSTPIVWGDRIFLTSAEGNDLVLLCVSTAGKELWKKKITSTGRSAIRMDEGNDASATPCTDGKFIYAFVATGHCACFDFEGKEIWNFDVQKRYGKFSIQHGMHTTPLLHENRLYLSLLHNNANIVVAIDKATGDEVWKHARVSDAKGESREAYSSPILWGEGDKQGVVILGSDYTTAHRLSDGKEIWRLGDLNPKGAKYSSALRIIATPVASRDLLVVPTARGGIMVALKAGASGEILTGSPHEQWRKIKGAPDVPSPLIYGGLVYLPRENGVLQCWDAMTGEEFYQQRLHADRYRASPVYANGNVYVNSRDGTFSVVKVGSKFESVATNILPDIFTASPAISGSRIYLRGFTTLYAIEEGK